MELKENALKIVNEIFRKELEDNTLVITYESSTETVEKWDSVNNLLLISSMEDTFDVTFPIEVIFEAKNVGDLCDYLVNHSKKIQ